MLNIISSIAPIFFLILSGAALKKYFIKSGDFWKSAEALTYYLLFPCLLILKIGSVDFNIGESLSAISITIGVTAIIGLITFLLKALFHIPNALFTSIFQGSTRYNSYVFLAMSEVLFGASGVGLTGLFIAYMIVFTNVLSVMIMNHYGCGANKSLKSVFQNLFKNPLILGAIIGVAFNLFGIHLVDFLKNYMTILSGAASPLSLLAVGAGLRLSLSKEKKYAISLSVTLKLIVTPIITIPLVYYFNLGGMVASIVVLYSCLPCAGNAYILARQMGGDADSMASIITLTTLGSVISSALFLSPFVV